jgi:hypothetical protein
MNTFPITNHEELWNAIWSSKPGDTIKLEDGEYGYIPIKQSVNYEFSENASVAGILGLGISLDGGAWSAEEISVGNISITKPTVKNDNIKMYHVFRKKLPFNSRFPHPTTIIHPNGVIMSLLNETIGDNYPIGSAENALMINPQKAMELPYDYIQIRVPSFDPSYKFPENDKEIWQLLNALRINNDNTGLILNDYSYLALWAVNDFIQEYASLFELDYVEQFNISEFCYSLEYCLSYSDGTEVFPFQKLNLIRNFKKEIDIWKIPILQGSLFNTRDFSLADYVIHNLEKLNYQTAVIGMYQMFEEGWEVFDPTKNNKWAYIESKTTDPSIKKNLAEMINARNWIVHDRILKTEDKKKCKSPNPLKTETNWNAEELNQFQIFYRKKPWEWYKGLKEFLT